MIDDLRNHFNGECSEVGMYLAMSRAAFREGYPEIAEIVRQHHDPDTMELNEAAVVYIADKAVQGRKRVPIAERFDRSLSKCKTSEALAAHEKRRQTAETIQNEINRLCGEAIL